MTLAELSNLIGTRLQGDAALPVSGVSSLRETEPSKITLLADAARLAQLDSYTSRAFIVPEKLASHDALTNKNLLIAKDAKLAFARAINVFHGQPLPVRGVSDDLKIGDGSTHGKDCSIHPRVTIGANCIIGKRVTLHPGVVLGDRCFVGDDSVIFPNVSIYDDSEIGARCRLHSGVVIGADVMIEDDVEIGANVCIDRAGFGITRISRGAKFDNLIQIGHNCEIGEDSVVAALTGFSGGTTVGRNVIIAGQVGTNQHINIGDRAIVTARAGVTKSVEAGAIVGGLPVQDHRKWRRLQALIAKLPELFERVKKLEKEESL
jgi:UDP-3-O-[3-hydroxymyristoyl] glucosamine N-acyltransferase